MFDESKELSGRIREGLGTIPVPKPGREFNERVHEALRNRPSPWITAWWYMRPVLATAAASLAATLIVLQWLSISGSPGGTVPARFVARRPTGGLDPGDDADLSQASLFSFQSRSRNTP
jgi:hypothetical protein